MNTVCLCGSARFETQFKQASKMLGLMGIVVIGLSSYPSENEGNKSWYQPDEKEMLDLVHLEKIRMADAVLVIDGEPTFSSKSSHDPYIGFSTAREILWARVHDKPIISLLSASGWGNIREMIEHRYDKEWFGGHDWLPGHAAHVLRVEAGKSVATDLIEDTAKTILHAGLSYLACGNVDTHRRPQESAESWFESRCVKILEAAGLDPMDGDKVRTLLSGVVELSEPAKVSEQPFIHAEGIADEAVPVEMVSIPLAEVRRWRQILSGAEMDLLERGNRVKVRELIGNVVRDLTDF